MFEWPRRLRLEIVEANAELRSELARALVGLGFEVEAVGEACLPGSRDEQARYALHVIDLAAPGATRWLADPSLAERCLFLAADASDAADALALSARAGRTLDLLVKPFSIQTLEARLLRLMERLSEGARGPDLLRSDPLLQTCDPRLGRAFERAFRIAREDCPICIEGELGTGRRALARAIHAASARADAMLLPLECRDLSDRAGEAALHELARRVANAAQATLLLIDPEALSARAQGVLQAALRGGEDGRVPRCITISRVSLDESAREGQLSSELLYRLSGVRIQMPPLRERAADQLAICSLIARRVARELGIATPVVAAGLVERLAREGFPGNRLGLESRLRSALIRGDEGAALEDLLFDSAPAARRAAERPPSLDLKTLERDTIIRALGHARGNRTHASHALGISVRTLRNKIRDYGLR